MATRHSLPWKKRVSIMLEPATYTASASPNAANMPVSSQAKHIHRVGSNCTVAATDDSVLASRQLKGQGHGS